MTISRVLSVSAITALAASSLFFAGRYAIGEEVGKAAPKAVSLDAGWVGLAGGTVGCSKAVASGVALAVGGGVGRNAQAMTSVKQTAIASQRCKPKPVNREPPTGAKVFLSMSPQLNA